jgi:hypothetical protein
MNHRVQIGAAAMLLLGLLRPDFAQAACSPPNPIAVPELYPVGWLPWLIDLGMWRNYDPRTIPGAGRLIASPNGSVIGESIGDSVPTCNILQPGDYTFVMKWQNDENATDYVGNTDIIYLKQVTAGTKDYIRHSQLGSGLPVFCAGTFKISNFSSISYFNEIVEVTNSSGHYTPNCRCLGVLKDKLKGLNIFTSNTLTALMGSAQAC